MRSSESKKSISPTIILYGLRFLHPQWLLSVWDTLVSSKREEIEGVLAPTDANPTIVALETNVGAWTTILGLGLGFWHLDKHSGPWIRMPDFGEAILGSLDQEFWILDEA